MILLSVKRPSPERLLERIVYAAVLAREVVQKRINGKYRKKNYTIRMKLKKVVYGTRNVSQNKSLPILRVRRVCGMVIIYTIM